VTGSVLVGGRDVADLSDKQFTALRGKDIAMVFQEPGAAALDPHSRWGTRSARPSARTPA
jgi:peptide/nickel transport system ATP-binding protein